MPRIQVALNLYMFSVLGVFLLAVPWTPMWEQTTFVFLPAALGSWVRSGWARGAVTGLGALDLLAASQEVGALLRSFRSGEQGGEFGDSRRG